MDLSALTQHVQSVPEYEQAAPPVSADVSSAEKSVRQDTLFYGYETMESQTVSISELQPFSKTIPLSASTDERRLELMAKKYVGKSWSREEEARLQIDHQKIENLYPSVEPEQKRWVEMRIHELEESDEEISNLLSELGIS